MDQPAHTPTCCGQPAKWVEVSVNLKYFYCEKCKKEVPEDKSGSYWGPIVTDRLLDKTLFGIDPASLSPGMGNVLPLPKSAGSGRLPQQPPPAPANTHKFNMGDVIYGPGGVTFTITDIDYNNSKYRLEEIGNGHSFSETFKTVDKYCGLLGPKKAHQFQIGDRVKITAPLLLCNGLTGTVSRVTTYSTRDVTYDVALIIPYKDNLGGTRFDANAISERELTRVP